VFKIIGNILWVVGLVVLALLLHKIGFAREENNYWSDRANLRRGGGLSDFDKQVNVNLDGQEPGGGGAGGESGVESGGGAGVGAGSGLGDGNTRSFAECVGPYGILRAGLALEQGGGPFVVLIRDLHGNKTAQQNIASLISVLALEQGVSLVGLEGAAGGFVTEEFGSYPDRSIVDTVGTHFLNTNLISGAEFAGLSLSASPQRLTLWGVESARLYQSNVSAVKESLARRESAWELIQSIDGATALQKNRLYSPALVSFDKNQHLYDSNKIDVGAYLAGLVALDPDWDRAAFPNVDILIRLLQAEKQVDVLRVKREQRLLAEELETRLSARGRGDVDGFRLTSRRNDGQRGGDRGVNIEEAIERAGIELHKYPALAARVRLDKEVQRIDHELLLSEIERLGQSVQARLAESVQQQELVRLDQDRRLLGRLFRLEMTPEDWATYNQRRDEILGLPDRLHLKLDLGEAVGPFESFWALAVRRDRALAFNLLNKMRAMGDKSAVLVVGGFHADGVAHYLAKEGVAVRVVTPNASFSEQEKNYVDSFGEEPPALRDLINGQQIALKTYCPLAAGAENDSVRKALHIFIAGLTAWGKIKAESAGVSGRELLDKLREFMGDWPFQPELVGVSETGCEIDLDGERFSVGGSGTKPLLTLMASNGNKNGGGSSTGNGRENNGVSWKRRLWLAFKNFVLEKQTPLDPHGDALKRKVERVSDLLVGAYQAGTLTSQNRLMTELNITQTELEGVANQTLRKIIAGKKASLVNDHPLSGDFIVVRFEGLGGVIGVLPRENNMPATAEFNRHFLEVKGSLGKLVVPASLVFNQEPFLLDNKSIVRTSILLMKDFTNTQRHSERRFFSLKSNQYWPSKSFLTAEARPIKDLALARQNRLEAFSETIFYAGWEPVQKQLKEKDFGVLELTRDHPASLDDHLVLCNPWAIKRRESSGGNSAPHRVPDVFSDEIAKAQRRLIADRLNRKSASPVPEAKPGKFPIAYSKK
jgi:hypothetical protein